MVVGSAGRQFESQVSQSPPIMFKEGVRLCEARAS